MATHLPSEAGASESSHFDLLYREWYDRVVRVCEGLVGDRGDAEAIAQETFIRVWASWGKYDTRQPFGPWVCTIARRLCLNYLNVEARREAIQPPAVAAASMPVAGPDSLERVLDSHAVAETLASLPHRARRLLFLRDVDGWSYDSIAAIEGTTTEAVRTSLKRARQAFRATYRRISDTVLGGIGLTRRKGIALRTMLSDRLAATPMLLGRSAVVDGAAYLIAALLLAGAPASGSTRPTPIRATYAAAAPVDAAAAPASAAVPAGGGRPTAGANEPRRADAASAPGTDTAAAPFVTYQFTPSPSYDRDRTVFAAAGRRTSAGCPAGCVEILKSTNGGQSWSAFPAALPPLLAWSSAAPRVLLPPSYPADGRIFVATAESLFVTDDDGTTFRFLANVQGDAMMSPAFSDGDPRIFFAPTAVTPLQSLPVVMVYDDRDQRVHTADIALPPGQPLGIYVPPSYPVDGRVFVLAEDTRPGFLDGSLSLVRQTTAMFDCGPSSCEKAFDLSSAPAAPRFLWMPQGPIVAWNYFGLYRGNEGSPFQSLQTAGAGGISDMTATRDGRLLVLHQADLLHVALLESSDQGTTWHTVAVTDGIFGLFALPDGTLLTNRTVDGVGRGIQRSSDGGRTWSNALRTP